MSEAPAIRDNFVWRTAVCLAPILIWAAHFGAVYGGTHVTCAVSGDAVDEGLSNFLILGVTVVAMVAISAIGLGARRLLGSGGPPRETEAKSFLVRVAEGLALLSFIGVGWAGLASVFLPTCADR